MLREIITPQSENYVLHIPKEYINQKIEILVLPFTYPHSPNTDIIVNKNILKKTAGLLASRNIDPLKWQREIRDEWDR